MKKKLWAGMIILLVLLLSAGCDSEKQETASLNSAYTPVQENRSMSYDAATDMTTLVNAEATLQLKGQWEEKDGCYTNSSYGFVNFIHYNTIITVYDYTNEYSSSADWPIGGRSSKLTISPLTDRTTYGFHVDSDTATYKFIYTTDPSTDTGSAASIIATVLQTFKFQTTASTNE